MGLNDLVKEDKLKSGSVDADASDITLSRQAWLDHLLYNPQMAFTLAGHNRHTDVPFLLIDMLNEIIEEGVDGNVVHDGQREELKKVRDEIKDEYL